MDATSGYYYGDDDVGGVPADVSLGAIRAKYAAVGQQQGVHPGRSLPTSMLIKPDLDKRAEKTPTENVSPGYQHQLVVGGLIVGAVYLVWKSANL